MEILMRTQPAPMRVRLGALLIVGLGVLVFADRAAALALRLEIVGDPSSAVTIEDNGAGDADPADGSITFSGPLGSVLTNVTVNGISTPRWGTSSHPEFIVSVVSDAGD